MGRNNHFCTSGLVCSFLLGALHFTVALQNDPLANVPNLLLPKSVASISSLDANESSKLLFRKKIPENLVFGKMKNSHFSLLQPKRSKKNQQKFKLNNNIDNNNNNKMPVKNKYSHQNTWSNKWRDSFLLRQKREVSHLQGNNVTSNYSSSMIDISEKSIARHNNNHIELMQSLSLKPTKTQPFLPGTKLPSDLSHSLSVSKMTSSSWIPTTTSLPFLPNIQNIQLSSDYSINTNVPEPSFQSSLFTSVFVPPKIIPTPSVILSSNINSLVKLPEVKKTPENFFSSSTIQTSDFHSQSFTMLQSSMPSLVDIEYHSIKTITESSTKSLSSIALTTSMASVRTPTLITKPLTATNFSIDPRHTSTDLYTDIIPTFLDLSSISLLSHKTNKDLSSMENNSNSISLSLFNVFSDSLLTTRINQDKNLTLGGQPTQTISAQTQLSSTLHKSLNPVTTKSLPINLSPILNTVTFLPHFSSEILPSKTLQTTMKTKQRINTTSTWYHPASARMISPLSAIAGLKTTSASNADPKAKNNLSSTIKTYLNGANYSLPQMKQETGLEQPSTSQSSSNSTGPDSEYAGDLLAEPVPDWEIAKVEWKAAWEVHLYLFGILFAILAIYTFVSIVRLWHIKHLLSKQYFVVLNSLLFLFCLLRTLFLLIDGYNSNHTFLPVIEYFLISTGFPCLSSSFGVLFYALLNATKVQMLPNQIQRLPVLICIILFHFLLSLSANIFIAFFVNARILLFVCQLFFILWGLFLFLGYVYAFRTLYIAAQKRQKSLLQLQQAANNSQWEKNYLFSKERLTLSLGIKVTLLSAIFGTICACLQAYAALGVFGVFSKETPQPWPWWGYQTSIRFVEFFYCLTMIYVATQPFKYQSKYDWSFSFYFSSCIQLCQIKSVWNTDNIPSWNELDEAITNTLVTKNGGRKEIKAAGYEIIPMTITLSTDADLSTQDPLENESMLVVQDGFVRFRTNEELEELRRSPRIPRMDLTDSKPIPIKPKVLQWGENSSRGHQNGGFQSGDTLPGHMSPDCISTSTTSPSSSQWNRISTTGSDFTFRPPSLSLAESIDKELEQYFRRSSICSERSLSSIRSASMPEGIEMGNSDMSDTNSVFPSEGSPWGGNGPMDADCLPDFDLTFSVKQSPRGANVKNKLVNNVRYLSLDDLEKCPQNSSCAIQWKTDIDS